VAKPSVQLSEQGEGYAQEVHKALVRFADAADQSDCGDLFILCELHGTPVLEFALGRQYGIPFQGSDLRYVSLLLMPSRTADESEFIEGLSVPIEQGVSVVDRMIEEYVR
jgi:hypothetical protein